MSAPPPPEPPKKDDAPPPPAAPPAPPPATAKAPSEASTKKKGKSAGSLPPPSASPSGAAIGLRQVEVQSFSDIRPALQKWLDGQDKLFGAAEKSSGLEREKIFYAICGFLFLWLLAAPGAGLICNLIGVVYPAYASVVALRSAGKEDDTQWLVYWTTYGTFSLVDQFADRITPYFPLYWPLKALFLLYLYLPQTYGAQNMYVKYLDPAFDKLAKRVAGM
uniref:Receptor expression-enhancing protein n=2 Tax=Meloidogyne javanica TaxID=6303 RepID=A0A915MCE6_MELJA